MSESMERGPNYDWKHEAEHYRTECDKLRDLLCKVEAAGERDALALEAAQRESAALKSKLSLAVEALKRECCCPGEISWTTNEPILCEPREALKRIESGEG